MVSDLDDVVNLLQSSFVAKDEIIETIWILDDSAASDWERESLDWFHKLCFIGPQMAWFVSPAAKNSPLVCRSHSLFSH